MPIVAGAVAQHDVPIYLTGVGTVIARICRADDVAHVDVTNAGHSIDRRRQAREAELHLRGVSQRLVSLNGVLQLRDLRLLGLDQLWSRPAFVPQVRVAIEIGLGVHKLRLIAIAVRASRSPVCTVCPSVKSVPTICP